MPIIGRNSLYQVLKNELSGQDMHGEGYRRQKCVRNAQVDGMLVVSSWSWFVVDIDQGWNSLKLIRSGSVRSSSDREAIFILALNVPGDGLLAIRIDSLINGMQTNALIVVLEEDTTLDGAVMESPLSEQTSSGKSRTFI